MKTVVIVSTYVDNVIKERQKDTKFILFDTLEKLDEYTAHTPIRADQLFFSKDVIPLVNTSLDFLRNILNKSFCVVTEVVFITSPNSVEIQSIEFLNKHYDTNWKIVEGSLSKEFIISVITGTALDDSFDIKRMATFRVPKDEYVALKLSQRESMAAEEYHDDDAKMSGIPAEMEQSYTYSDSDNTAKICNIIGTDSIERTLFAFVIAQYLSTTGKTIILERDINYHLLGELVTKSGVDCEIVDISGKDMNTVIRIVRDSPHNLVCIIAKRRLNYNYAIYFNYLYCNLSDSIEFAVREGGFGEEPNSTNFTVVFPCTVPGVLEASSKVAISSVHNAQFVGVHLNTPKAIRLVSPKSIIPIIEDVTNRDSITNVKIVELDSLRIGGETSYDIKSVVFI